MASTFTTSFSVSTQGPQVVGVSPPNGLAQVPINAIVTLQFNEPVNSESLGQVTLRANGVTVAVAAAWATATRC